MTPERWQQIKGVLDQSLDLNPGARTAFLEQVCSGDLSLRHEVEQLLAAEKKAGPEFLNTSAISLSLAEGFTPKTDTWIGRRIGSYANRRANWLRGNGRSLSGISGRRSIQKRSGDQAGPRRGRIQTVR